MHLNDSFSQDELAMLFEQSVSEPFRALPAFIREGAQA
jgi:hypothetical protein